MALIYVLPIELKETVNKQTGEVTNLQLMLRELSPSNTPVKVFGQPAAVLNRLQKFIDDGKPVALPVRQGTLDNGNIWRNLEEDKDILPIDPYFLHEKQLEEFARLRYSLFPQADNKELLNFLFPDKKYQEIPQSPKVGDSANTTPAPNPPSPANDVNGAGFTKAK